MEKQFPSFVLLIICLLVGNLKSAEKKKQQYWWLEPQRMLQTNLRQIDATMDIDKYVCEVKDFGANVVLFNVGGIVANYPTELEYHYRNPYMKGDLVGTIIERLHKEGIRIIGRFDFSKVNEKYAAEHPEWLYVNEKGEHVNYNGQVHTCVSGGYQQEYMFKILGEAIERYPLDGVFFNMIGYTRSDYSGNYHGLCQCENCKRLFKEYCGMELPRSADSGQGEALDWIKPASWPATYAKYMEFTHIMSDKQFQRVNSFLKKKRPDLAICTYTTAGVDVIRKESNSALGRGTYYDTEKAKRTLLEAGQRQLANAAVHFFAIPYRHAAVSPYLTVRRLWQHMVNGAWLDFYCIGPLQRQEDRTGLDLAADLYNFHANNEKWLKQTEPAGQVALVQRGEREYDGLLQILSENQIAFELVLLDLAQLQKFPLVIVPDAGGLAEKQSAVLDKYVKSGGRLLLTGKVPETLNCVGSVKLKETRPAEKGAYVRIRPEDRRILNRSVLEKLDLVFLDGPFNVYEIANDTEKLLRLIPADMFGPPEKCYYRHVTDHPALLYNRYGKGAAACFTFGIGTHYQQQYHQGHSDLLIGSINGLLGLNRRLKVEASPLVEATHRFGGNGRFEWVGLFNHSGQRDKALHQPVPITDIKIELQPRTSVKSVHVLKAGCELDFSTDSGGRISIIVPRLNHYEIVLFEY